MVPRILLVAPEPARTAVARVFEQQPIAEITPTADSRNSLAWLRREDFDLILIDGTLAAADPEVTEALYAGARTAPVVEINFAICGAERVLREVRAALSRRAQNEAKARIAAAAALGNDLNACLTALLLQAQLALRDAGPELAAALEHLIQLAAELRPQLRA